MSSTLLLLRGPAPIRTVLAFMASLATNETLPREVPPSLSLLPPALVAVTVPPLALLALLKLLLTILTLLVLMAVRTLMALPETSLSVPEIS